MKTQRITKILSLFILVIAISVAGTINVEANYHKVKQYHGSQLTIKKHKKPTYHHKKKKCVNTPLDAGVLLLLTGAGAAYIGIRRKQKK